MDTDHEEERNERDREAASCSFCTFVLKGGHKEGRPDNFSILPRRPLHWKGRIAPISDDEPTVPGEEPPQREISGDITRPENGTRRNPYHETRSRRWEKLRKNVSSGKEGIPDDAIVDRLKNRPSRKQGNAGKIHSSDAT
jgi:hypothetical protein